MHAQYPPSLGAIWTPDGGCLFRVWAPRVERMELEIVHPYQRLVPMEPDGHGYYSAVVTEASPGTRYFYRLDGDRSRPDPASRFQPEGVHHPSEVTDSRFDWTDAPWFGLPLDDYIIYELHVGTFTPEGTFDAIIPHLDELRDVGFTAIELMPVAQFPGGRNWGYDGVHPFAVQNTYGGPAGLKRLVDACHARGLAVVLDVVYNHIGPEGNYLAEFAPYFTGRHRTPWGDALNFDGPHSDPVRRFFIENAVSWIDEFHIDALRLDAVHAIFDQSARPFLRELGEAVRRQGEAVNRRAYTIAESNLNDPRMVRPTEMGGFGLDGQWVDDLHHALHTALTGERSGYYEDFAGLPDLVHSLRQGFVYTGQYSRYRGRHHGTSSHGLPARGFVVCAQNHDQVGNRMLGERLTQLVSFEQLKLAAGAVLLSPYVPLLFMGEEYGEPAPFLYFVSHTDPDLTEAVRRGRREEFSTFRWQGEPPDPQDEATFLRSRLDHSLRAQGRHAVLREFHKTLIGLRKSLPALAFLSREQTEVEPFGREPLFLMRRWTDADQALCVFHFGPSPAQVALPAPAGVWEKRLDSSEERWHGPGSGLPARVESHGELALAMAPQSLAVFYREEC